MTYTFENDGDQMFLVIMKDGEIHHRAQIASEEDGEAIVFDYRDAGFAPEKA